MYSTIYKSGKAAVFLLSALVLASCGGGGSGDGGFTNPGDVLDMEWSTADGTNQVDWFFVSSESELQDCGAADFGLNPVKELTLQVFDQEGQFFAAEEIAVSLSRTTGNGSGSICVPIPEGVTPEEGVNDCGGNGLFGPFSRFVFEESNGIEKVFFFAGANANGTVELEATTEDPASGQLISERFTMNILPTEPTLPIGIPVTAMTFTGPFVNAVLAGENTIGLQEGETILQDGSYKRLVSVIASDEDGNPPVGCVNNDIDFFLIDGPLVGYPSDGPGAFFTAGPDGDPEEGGFIFQVPPVPGGGFVGPVVNSTVVRPLNDRVLLDGRQEKNPGGSPLPNNRILSGIWRVESVLNDDTLAIEQRVDREGRSTPPFPLNPANANTGATVPYLVGSALNGNVLATGTLNEFGVANTVLTYPVWRLGQTAALAACTHFQQDLNEDGAITDPTIDRRVCTVLNTCDANGANCNSVYLPVTNGADITLIASPTQLGPNTETPLTLCLRDRNFSPLPASAITYDIDSFLGSASVTIDGSSALAGTLQTGADGCVTVSVASSGQQPGSDPIPLTFDSAGVAEPVVVEIVGPGAGNLSAILECGGQFCIDRTDDNGDPILNPGPVNCTIDLLLTDDRGGVIPDVGIQHSSDQALLSIAYNPASGNFGITDENGANLVSVSANSLALPTVTFTAGAATADVSLELPDCVEGDPPVPVEDPVVSLLAGKTTLAPGESTTFQLLLDKPATSTISVGIITAGDTDQFTLVPTSVTISAGQSSAAFTVSSDATAFDGAAIDLQLTSGTGYTLGDAGPVTLTVGALQATVETAATAVQPGASASFTVKLSAPAVSDTTVNLVVSGPAVAPPTSVLIPAGSSAGTVDVDVSGTASAGDTITLTINAGTGYVVGDPGSASIPVEVPALPVASLSGDVTVEAGGTATLAVTLDKAATSALTITLLETGGNVGSFITPASVSIPAGSASASFSVTAAGAAQDGDSVTVSIAGGTGYTVGDSASATVTVSVDPVVLPVATIQPTAASLVAASGDSVALSVVLNEVATANLTIGISVTGNTGSFTGVPTSVLIAAGDGAAVINVTESSSTAGDAIQVRLVAGTGYTVGSPNVTTITSVP